MYNAHILKDSLSPAGVRLTTWELTYPRFVHAELMTHRVFSRNSTSSRAIPVQRLVDRVRAHPVLPQWWGKNQAGMQADEEVSQAQLERARDLWLRGRDQMLDLARNLSEVGLHKQIANRVVEPWMFVTVIVSATNFANWFRLRNHADAQPEIKKIASIMLTEYRASTPEVLMRGQWHLPLLPDQDALCQEGFNLTDLKFISAGRVARVSYLTHEGVRDPTKDRELGMRLATQDPPHMSPLEHVAEALSAADWRERVQNGIKEADLRGELFNPMRLGNFVGWKQFRKEFDNEHGFDFNWEGMT